LIAAGATVSGATGLGWLTLGALADWIAGYTVPWLEEEMKKGKEGRVLGQMREHWSPVEQSAPQLPFEHCPMDEQYGHSLLHWSSDSQSEPQSPD